MPIITPSYPSMCTTHNVGMSSMRAIQQELEKGARLTDEIMLGRRAWNDLFTKHTFFTTGFKFYLTVVSSSRTREAQNKWSSFIESRVRVLVQKLDLHPSIDVARPFTKGYDRTHRCRTNAQIEEVQAGCLAYLAEKDCAEEEATTAKPDVKTDTNPEIKSEVKEANGALPSGENGASAQEAAGAPPKEENGAPSKQENNAPPIKAEETDHQATTMPNGVKGETADGEEAQVKLADIPELNPPADAQVEIYTTNHYIGLQLMKNAKSLDLSREVNDFKAMCMSNDIFQPDLMCLTIQHLKSWELPGDVFEPGEVKPTRPIRKKRLASEDPGKPDAKRQQMTAAAS